MALLPTPHVRCTVFVRSVLLAIVLAALLPALDFRVAGAADDPPPIPSPDLRSRLISAEQEAGDRSVSFPEFGSRAVHDDYDVTHYDIALGFDIGTRILYGTVEVEAESQTPGLLEVALDLYSPMVVDAVTVNGSPATYGHANGLVTVQLDTAYQTGESFVISCTYHGTPSYTLSPFRWNLQAGVPMILSYSEPYGAPAWWVCKDDPKDKATFAVHMTVPDTLYAVSNGRLDSIVDHGNGTETYNWTTDYPMSTYLCSIAITNYEIWTEVYTALDGKTTMDVDYYAYPADLADAQVSWSHNVEMMEYFASIFGEYPFLDERYGIAEFQHSGAMEHQTCTSMGWTWVNGTYSNDFVVAHELAHSWVGDMITMREWSHAWCKEGFATYCEALYFEDKYGTNYYHAYMEDMNVLTYADYRLYDISPPLHAAIYYKGAWVFHMLRHVLGDSAFFDAIRAYTNDPDLRYGVANTEEMRDVFEESSGVELNWFFDQWIFEGWHPEYQANWSPTQVGDGYETYLVIVQTQANGPTFKMPIDVRITTDLGEENFVVWDSLDVQAFTLATNGAPLGLELDPDNWILQESVPSSAPNTLPGPSADAGPRLYPSRPNPTTGTTWIEFELPAVDRTDQDRVELGIYDATGRMVVRLVEGVLPVGRHRVRWDGTDGRGRRLPAGTYWSRLRVEEGERSQPIVLIR